MISDFQIMIIFSQVDAPLPSSLMASRTRVHTPYIRVTMMLGLVGERILAVEEDLAALVLSASSGGDVDHTTSHVSSGSSLLQKDGGGAGGLETVTSATTTTASYAGQSLPLVRWAAHISGWSAPTRPARCYLTSVAYTLNRNP